MRSRHRHTLSEMHEVAAADGEKRTRSIDCAEAGLRDAGFGDVSITVTNTVGEGVHSAIIKATNSAIWRPPPTLGWVCR